MPATDAFLAGIKADAIDEAAVELDRVDTVANTRVIGFKLREFSQQLREGQMRSVIDFEGARFFVNGRTSNVLPDGTEVNIRHQLNITLTDGTQFIKSIWYPFNWERWIDKKQHHRHADIGGFTGRYRHDKPYCCKRHGMNIRACSMTDITELAQSLKAAAEKATPGPWALARDRKTVVSISRINR